MQEKKKKFLSFAPLRKRNGDEKMNFRTDLALEVRENLEGSRIDGVECTSFESAGAEITRLRVTDRRGEEILGKPRGEYITVQSQSFARSSRISDELIDAVAQELSRLLPSEGTVLAAGLGNTNITPDALGPKFIGGVFVTRHLKRELCEQLGLGRLRPVAAIAPGVLGQTGVETGELLLGADWGDGCGVIFNIYRLDGAKAVRVVDGWSRSQYFLCSDGTLAHEWSGGADHWGRTYLRYGETLLQAARLDDDVVEAMAELATLTGVGACRLVRDYNFTDTANRRYRYQAVFEIVYY